MFMTRPLRDPFAGLERYGLFVCCQHPGGGGGGGQSMPYSGCDRPCACIRSACDLVLFLFSFFSISLLLFVLSLRFCLGILGR